MLARWQNGSRTYNGRDECLSKLEIDASDIVCGRIHCGPVEGEFWANGECCLNRLLDVPWRQWRGDAQSSNREQLGFTIWEGGYKAEHCQD